MRSTDPIVDPIALRGRTRELEGALEAVQAHVAELEREVAASRRQTEALRRSEQTNAALSQISAAMVTSRTDEEMYDSILHVVLDVMASPHGVVGYIDEHGDLVCPSMTRHIWAECQVPDKTIVFPENMWGGSIWGRGLKTGIARYENRPFAVPGGHLPVTRCLTAPLVLQGRSVGLLTVANKSDDYTDTDLETLRRIAEHVAPVLHARIDEQRAAASLKQSEAGLNESQRVARIGHYLFDIASNSWTSSAGLDAVFGIGPGFPRTTEGWIGLVHPDDREMTRDHLVRHVVTEGHPFDREYRIQRASDGATRWVHGLGQLRVDQDGHPTHMFGTIQDIDDSKAAERDRDTLRDQLAHAQRLESIGRLAGGVAHDFNNMLVAILGNAALASELAAPGSELAVHLDEIRKAAERSAQLVRQLLAFARKQTVTPRVLDLNATIERMLKMLERLIGEHIRLVWKPGPGLWPVKIDPAQMDQLLANLTVNARDAIGSGGTITIETENVHLDDTSAGTHLECTPGDYVMLAVSDTGRGMDEATRAHLFEPFFTTKAPGEGTGLGLATVFGIVKQNGGLINVSSELGEGSAFTIYLGRAVEDRPAEGDADLMRARPGSETILLAEDEAQVLTLAQRILVRHGYRVLTAHTPEAAIATASGHPEPIDLLITDVVMPGMNGLDLYRRIETLKPGIRCLFMSGYTADVVVHHGVVEEGVDFLQKPFTIESLTEKVRTILDSE